MSITKIFTDITGQADITPRIVRIYTSDNFATITTANYLQNSKYLGFQFYPSDMVCVTYNAETTAPISQLFNLTMTSSTITLKPVTGSITLPVTDGNVAQFDGTTGKIKNGPVAANALLTSALTTPDVGANLITFNVTVGFAALASAGSVILIDSSGTKRYRIKQLQLNSGGTNFSGGGGDRLGQVTDGTTVYSVIPAASLQTLANAQWGATALPNPASAAINTLTVAGTDLVFKYSGGTTDYTAGSLVISGLAERVA